MKTAQSRRAAAKTLTARVGNKALCSTGTGRLLSLQTPAMEDSRSRHQQTSPAEAGLPALLLIASLRKSYRLICLCLYKALLTTAKTNSSELCSGNVVPADYSHIAATSSFQSAEQSFPSFSIIHFFPETLFRQQCTQCSAVSRDVRATAVSSPQSLQPQTKASKVTKQ